jgi:hypothetical protein
MPPNIPGAMSPKRSQENLSGRSRKSLSRAAFVSLNWFGLNHISNTL